jgi:hypothetical protein
VTRIGCVVLAFFDTRKGRDTVLLAQGVELVATPGENLVRIGLVADVPHDFVFGRIEHVVQRDADFHGAERPAEVSAVAGDGIDDEMTEFGCHFGQLAHVEPLQIRR